MTHPWKIGDWCEVEGERGFIYSVDQYGLHVVATNQLRTWHPSDAKHLPLCDSWDWQPPQPPDPGEGYRLIDPAVDEPQEGDEIYYSTTNEWGDRGHNNPYNRSRFYRRKLPAYAPFTAESFKPHRDRWIRNEGHPGAFRIDAYDDYGFLAGVDKYPWDFLRDEYVFDDTNTPCGVPV